MRDLDATPPTAGGAGAERDPNIVVDLSIGTFESIGRKRHSPLPSPDVTAVRIPDPPPAVHVVRSVRHDQPPQQHLSTRFRVVDAQVPRRVAATTSPGSARRGLSRRVIGAALVVALGLASLVWTAVVRFGAHHEDRAGASVSAATASVSPIATTTSPPSDRRSGPVAQPSSSGRGRVPRADVRTPTDGATVDRCFLVAGTSHALPIDHTLVVATGPTGGNGRIRMTPVQAWARPETLTSWTARTILGASSVGQRLSVAVVEVPVSTVRHGLHADTSSWSVTALPPHAVIRDSVSVSVDSFSTLCGG